MAIVREAFNDGSPSSAPSASATIATWAIGDTCLVNVRWYGTPTLSSVTLTGESNLTLLGTPQTGGPSGARSQWALLSNVTSTGSKTATATLSAAPDQMAVSMWRLSGCDTSGAEDARNGASGNSAAPSVSVTTATAAAAIFAIMSNNDGEATQGSGYTAETIGDILWYDSGEYDIDVGAAGAKTVNFTMGGANEWVINAIAIKPAAAGGPFELTPTAPVALTATLSVAGTLDVESPVSFELTPSAPLALTAALGVSGELDAEVPFELGTPGVVSMTAVLAASGELAFGEGLFSLTPTAPLAVTATLAVAGEISTPVLFELTPSAPLALTAALGVSGTIYAGNSDGADCQGSGIAMAMGLRL